MKKSNPKVKEKFLDKNQSGNEMFCLTGTRTIEIDGRKFGVRSFFPCISDVSTKDKILQFIDFDNSEK